VTALTRDRIAATYQTRGACATVPGAAPHEENAASPALSTKPTRGLEPLTPSLRGSRKPPAASGGSRGTPKFSGFRGVVLRRLEVAGGLVGFHEASKRLLYLGVRSYSNIRDTCIPKCCLVGN